MQSFKQYFFLKESNAINSLQNALDIAGFEPTIGSAADATNVVISGLRAALSKEPDERKRHIINAGISAVSLIPFADIIKLLNLRKTPGLAKPVISSARALKRAATTTKLTDRFNS